MRGLFTLARIRDFLFYLNPNVLAEKLYGHLLLWNLKAQKLLLNCFSLRRLSSEKITALRDYCELMRPLETKDLRYKKMSDFAIAPISAT